MGRRPWPVGGAARGLDCRGLNLGRDFRLFAAGSGVSRGCAPDSGALRTSRPGQPAAMSASTPTAEPARRTLPRLRRRLELTRFRRRRRVARGFRGCFFHRAAISGPAVLALLVPVSACRAAPGEPLPPFVCRTSRGAWLAPLAAAFSSSSVSSESSSSIKSVTRGTRRAPGPRPQMPTACRAVHG